MEIKVKVIKEGEEAELRANDLQYIISEKSIAYMRENRADFTQAFNLLTNSLQAGIDVIINFVRKVKEDGINKEKEAFKKELEEYKEKAFCEFVDDQENESVLWGEEMVKAYKAGSLIAMSSLLELKDSEKSSTNCEECDDTTCKQHPDNATEDNAELEDESK